MAVCVGTKYTKNGARRSCGKKATVAFKIWSVFPGGEGYETTFAFCPACGVKKETPSGWFRSSYDNKPNPPGFEDLVGVARLYGNVKSVGPVPVPESSNEGMVFRYAKKRISSFMEQKNVRTLTEEDWVRAAQEAWIEKVVSDVNEA